MLGRKAAICEPFSIIEIRFFHCICLERKEKRNEKNQNDEKKL